MAKKPNYITNEDIAAHKVLDKLLSDKVKWDNLSTQDAILVYKSLVWFAQLKSKLEDNLFDMSQVKTTPINPPADNASASAGE